MLKRLLLCTALSIPITGPAAAQPVNTALAAAPPAPAATVSIHPTNVLLAEISAWLVQNFDLPVASEPPKIVFAAPAAIAAIRYRSLVKDRPLAVDNRDVAVAGSEIVAIYDDKTHTIVLPHGWRGETPAEMSVLVHEMVHHLQKLAGIKFRCPEEREKLAFEAQNRWLERFDRSLESEFELDGFTLLVRTNCGF